jgi:hypothetical protein
MQRMTALVCNWDPKKSLVRAGACLHDEALIEVCRHAVQVHRRAALGDLAYKSAAEPELDVSEDSVRETVGGGDHVPTVRLVCEIAQIRGLKSNALLSASENGRRFGSVFHHHFTRSFIYNTNG